MDSEDKTSGELIDSYEKNFGAAGRRRVKILFGIAGLLLVIIVVGFASTMSYVGSLNSHVYHAFGTQDQNEKNSQATAP